MFVTCRHYVALTGGSKDRISQDQNTVFDKLETILKGFLDFRSCKKIQFFQTNIYFKMLIIGGPLERLVMKERTVRSVD
jgi:hypothetical protein